MRTLQRTMSWSELERLVEDAERDGRIARALRHCRSRSELLLAAYRMGYSIREDDLLLARGLDRQERSGPADEHQPLRSPTLAC